MPSNKSNARSASSANSVRKSSRSSAHKSSPRTHPKRTGIVWSVFIGTMTLAGGALVLSDNWGADWKGPPLVSIATEPTTPITATPDTAPSATEAVANGGWSQIIVHESGSLVGSLDGLTHEHVAAGLPSLGYHFVVGNGNGEQNGSVLFGPRWTAQQRGMTMAPLNGAIQYVENPNAIEVCVIGDSRRRALTDAQLESLASLVSDLSRHYGIAAGNVVRQQDRGGPVSFANDGEWARIQQRLAR